jgi:hypothetical protein
MARRLRKKSAFSKKTLALAAGLCLSYAPVAAGGEFLVSVYPQFTKPFGEAHNMQYGIGAGLRATYRPIKNLNLFAQGEYLSMALPGVDPVSLLEGDVGTGFHLDISDRLAFDVNLNVGVYNAKTTKSVRGIAAGGGLVFTYKITPSIYADVNGSAKHYVAKPSPLMMVNAGLGPGITFNVTEFFNNKTNLGIELNELDPVFPVLYSWYENNSFGKVQLTNNEESSITDVTVSFFQPQYMAHAKECATFKKIACGESVDVDLLAFFNEQMLELTEKSDTSSYIIVNYSRLGKKLSQSFALDVPVYGRNNMSWDDDRRAAVFVSSKDPAAMQFGKYTASIVRDNLRADMPVNIQYAIGIFQALNEFGLNYVVDPSSAFEDNVGTSSIDFLQFPYQTLMYRGGDCDDLSILVCSLFEAVGIDTAFITVPGHIFMAFDSGLTQEQAELIYRNHAEFIVVDDQVWVPLEITLSDEGFFRACRYGAREWNAADAQGTAALYRMKDSWEIYQPISVPGATAYFNIPDSNAILLAFQKGAEEWKAGELKTDPTRAQIQFVALNDEDEEEEQFVLKGNPLSRKSLSDIVNIGNAVAALSPNQVREEKSDDEFEGAGNDGDGDGDDDELLENIIPLDYALATATLQTDVNVKPGTTETLIFEDEESEVAEPAVPKTAKFEFDSETPVADTKVTVVDAESTVVEPVETTAVAETPAPAEAEEDTYDDLSFLEDYYERATQQGTIVETEKPAVAATENTVVDAESTVVEPVETTAVTETAATVASDDYTFETTDDFLADLEAAAEGRHSNEARHPATKTIIIISTVTIAAALAAGIIIFGKKKREEESK